MIANYQTIPVLEARSEEERASRLVAELQRRYRLPAEAIRVVRAPLRICPLGAHIDHQLGIVTGTGIDRAVLLAFAPTDDGRVQVESCNFDQAVSFDLNNVPTFVPGDWGNYVRGVVSALQGTYRINRGMVGLIESDMPIGGLSSSAAVTIAYLLSLEAVNGLNVTPAVNVSLVSATEHQYIGLRNGILDQSVILFSRAQYLTRIDCQTARIDHVPGELKPKVFDILVVYSGVTKSLVGTGYNARVAECQEAARQLLSFAGLDAGVDPRLRHVDPEIFLTYGHRLPTNVRKRATHFFGEMRRVDEGVEAWIHGDIRRLGRLISESGESSIRYYESGSPQLITLYEILRDTPGVYGTRFSGAGFRGSCIALVDPPMRQAVADAVHARYPAAHPDEAPCYSMHFCQPDRQAGILESWT